MIISYLEDKVNEIMKPISILCILLHLLLHNLSILLLCFIKNELSGLYIYEKQALVFFMIIFDHLFLHFIDHASFFLLICDYL